MSESLWRVVWNLAGTTGPRQSQEFTQERNAVAWAKELLKGGANGILLTELIVGRTIRFNTDAPLFQKQK